MFNRKEFFDKQHMITALWAVLIAVLAFIGGRFWSVVEGPDEVIIRNVDALNNTSTELGEPPTVVLDLMSKEEIEQLRNVISGMKEVAEAQSENATQLSQQYIKQLEAQVLALEESQRAIPDASETIEPAKSGEAVSGVNQPTGLSEQSTAEILEGWRRSGSPSSAIDDNEDYGNSEPTQKEVDDYYRTRQLHRPLFNLPDIAKGYQPTSSRFLKKPICPNDVIWESTRPTIGFTFADISKRPLMSPLLVKIIRSDADDTRTIVFEEQYQFSPGENRLELDTFLRPANYDLRFGYFLVSEVDEEFPKYYSHQCDISAIDDP